MDVSVIIVNYKTPEMVVDCVNSLREKTEGVSYEIIIVDNASGDESVAIMKKALGDTASIIESDVNLGFGKANNLGATYATGKYLFLLNSDTLFVNNALKILLDYIEQHDDVGVVGSNLYTTDMSPSPSFSVFFEDVKRTKSRSTWHSILIEILDTKLVSKYRNRQRQHKKAFKNNFNFTDLPYKVAFISGADMLIKRIIFNEVNGFDPHFFMYAEEEELSWRIYCKGYYSVNVPQAKIIHFNGASVKRLDVDNNERRFRLVQTGLMTYYWLRFGERGVAEYVRYFCRYLHRRFIVLGKLQRKPHIIKSGEGQIQLMQDVFFDFCRKNNLKLNEFGR